MSRLPEASPQQGQAKKQSSSRITVTRRLALSWTRWRQSRREKRERRQVEKLARTMGPVMQALLMEAMVPMAEALTRLDQRQQETYRQVRLLQTYQPETKELLLEILQSLQPSAEQVIAQEIGLHPQPISFPSSGS